MLSPTDTIAALATPAGTAAIAVVRTSGPAVKTLTAALCGKLPPARLAFYGNYHATDGTLLDSALFTFFQGPASYTGEDSLEISSHGNPYVAQRILEDLCERGCRPAEAGEFTQRAFLNGKLDLSQAEAVMDLIHAHSDRALMAANQQLRGSLGRRMSGLIERLLAVLARIEAYIDFPEDDLPIEDKTFIGNEIKSLVEATKSLLATSRYGEILRDGIKTVIIGEPNAGKSSLLNRLLGRERALVSPEPGTTRDFIEERILIGSHCLRLIDTAGLNPAPAPLEKLGMIKTLERSEEADLLLLVLDGTRTLPDFSDDLTARFASKPTLVLLNKVDRKDEFSVSHHFTNKQVINISALTGEGIAELEKAIITLAETFNTEHGDEVIAVNSRHADALRRAGDALADAGKKLREQSPIELLASDLRSTLEAYGEISGRVDNERMLDHLFASFCIGK